MSKRPPIKPTQIIRKTTDSDEEKDEIGELGGSFPIPRKIKDYSPVSLEGFFDNITWLGHIPIYWSGSSGPLVLAVHGAGLSGSSFAPIAKLCKNIPFQLVSFDFRGHGQNSLTEDEYSMNANILVSEVLQVLNHIREVKPGVNIIVIGHSMGGAIAAKACLEDQTNGGIVSGLIMVDVVEGSAIDALPHMDVIVNQRPKGFRSIEQAIS